MCDGIQGSVNQHVPAAYNKRPGHISLCGYTAGFQRQRISVCYAGSNVCGVNLTYCRFSTSKHNADAQVPVSLFRLCKGPRFRNNQVIPAQSHQVHRDIGGTHLRQKKVLIGFIVGILIQRIGANQAVQRFKTVAPQQCQIVWHISHRNFIITGEQETAALRGEFRQFCHLNIRQIFPWIEENQQVFRIRRIFIIPQGLIFHFILIGFQQVLEVCQVLQFILIVSLQDHSLWHPILHHIGNRSGNGTFKRQAVIFHCASLKVVTQSHKVLAAKDSEAVRLFTPDNEVGLSRHQVIGRKLLQQLRINRRIHLFPGDLITGRGILIQQFLKLQPVPFRGFPEQCIDLNRFIQFFNHGLCFRALGQNAVKGEINTPSLILFQRVYARVQRNQCQQHHCQHQG